MLLMFSQPEGLGFFMLFLTKAIGCKFTSVGGCGLTNGLLREKRFQDDIFPQFVRVKGTRAGTI